MTDLDQLIHTLPMSAKLTLLQLCQDPMTMVPPNIEGGSGLSTLLYLGLVNVRDRRVVVNQQGAALARSIATDHLVATCDRFTSIVSNVLACEGEIDGLEQAFCEPHFTAGEREMLLARWERVRDALVAAEK